MAIWEWNFETVALKDGEKCWRARKIKPFDLPVE